jgi:hypothetical protein
VSIIRLRRRTALAFTVAVASVTTLLTAPSAAEAAGPRPLFRLPFTCGQQWVAVTRSDHSPNPNSLDLTKIGNDSNNQPILASAGGRVVKSGYDGGGGHHVRIDHGNGWQTRYLHMITTPAVSEGEIVSQGQLIGRVGSTGKSDGPHLHYEQIQDGVTVRSAIDGQLVTVEIGRAQRLTSQNCGTPAGGGYAFQANTGFLYTESGGDSGYGMMAGTSPATADGQAAFQANTGFLYTRTAGGSTVDSGYGMKTGTSPSISGGRAAFQANTGYLYTRDVATGATQDLGLGMMAGTSPSIAGDANSWRIAFQANSGMLYYRDSSGATVDTGYGMMAGTSPSITKLSNGTYVIAFQANTGLLYVRNGAGATSDTGYGMKAGTSPAVAASGTDWTTAFQANTGMLYTKTNTANAVDTGYGMMAGTSPAIRGTTVVFQANTGFLYTHDAVSRATRDTGYGMKAGTSPAI